MENRSPRTYQNLPAVITEELREAILNDELKEGDKLKQEDIAKQFSSSLIPVREALRSLESEGLVTFYPNRGAYVAALSPLRVRDIFETRIFIEMGALTLSIPLLEQEDLETAAKAVDGLDAAVSGKELSHYNRLFHSTLYSRCGNHYLLELIDALHRNVERYMRRYLVDHYNNDLSQDTHRRILEAARTGDVQEACTQLERHMRTAMGRLLTVLQDIRKDG